MKLGFKVALINLFFFATLPATAEVFDNSSGATNSAQTSANTKDLVKYLTYLGGYLGYDITQDPTTNGQISQKLLSISSTQLIENYVFNTFLAAIPVNAASAALSQFIPNSAPGAKIINALANATFRYQEFSSPSAVQQGKVGVNPLIDQQTYQQDPVSQAVLNILGTPDYTYCMSYDKTTWTADCKIMYQNQVMTNVLGAIPAPKQFFSYDYNQQLLGQLNTNSLMGPMLYSTENANEQNTGSQTPNSQNPGLTAQNQVQEAANFVRYATGGVVPATLPALQAYNTLYSQAYPSSSSVTFTQQMQALGTLGSYLTNLRVYAAQYSVGVSNLYYILSKRLPVNQGSDQSILTSQAMSEFKMATWRLFNSDLSSNKQWINQLNDASSATVQKEIATLLAEINYQMYLDRQIQERILLTNSITLIQNTKASQPSADLLNDNANQSGQTPPK